MISLIQRRLSTGLFLSLFLSMNIACSSNSVTENEVGEVGIDYPIHHYFSVPLDERIYQLSPDGKRLASLKAIGDSLNLVDTNRFELGALVFLFAPLQAEKQGC